MRGSLRIRLCKSDEKVLRVPAYANAPSYDIAPHVHVCVTGDGSVLLDLKRDKYLGLGKQETERVAAVVNAWPRPTWDATDGAAGWRLGNVRVDDALIDEAGTWDLCRSLAADGLLIRNERESAPTSRRPLRDMRTEWISIGDELEVASEITIAHVMNFLKAYTRARFSLAWRPFAKTVEAARVRKSQREMEFDPTHILRVAATVGIFRRLRPLVFAAEDRCLLHALTLINFLALYHLYPEWVIGVATQPWGAHSWVQWGNFLLDSNPEKVCRFTPILVV
jgi:Transglutaminase-like superfamily